MITGGQVRDGFAETGIGDKDKGAKSRSDRCDVLKIGKTSRLDCCDHIEVVALIFFIAIEIIPAL